MANGTRFVTFFRNSPSIRGSVICSVAGFDSTKEAIEYARTRAHENYSVYFVYQHISDDCAVLEHIEERIEPIA